MKLSITPQQTIVIAFLSIHENTLFVMLCRLSQKYVMCLWNIFPQISFFFYFSYVSPSDVFFTHTKILNFLFPHFENYMHHSTWKIWTFWRRWGSLLFTRRSLLSSSCADYLWVEQNSAESPCCLYIGNELQLPTKADLLTVLNALDRSSDTTTYILAT